jgi:hypothetical protein
MICAVNPRRHTPPHTGSSREHVAALPGDTPKRKTPDDAGALHEWSRCLSRQKPKVGFIKRSLFCGLIRRWGWRRSSCCIGKPAFLHHLFR